MTLSHPKGVVKRRTPSGAGGPPAPSDLVIDGVEVKADPERTGGVHANAAIWRDPHLENTCMLDKVGGSVSFYDRR